VGLEGGLVHCEACHEACEVPARPALRRDELPLPPELPLGEGPATVSLGTMNAWQSLRARVERSEEADVADRFCQLTRHLHGLLKERPETDRERRALLESALEVLPAPHEAEMAALLSQEALSAGDATAAEDWLRHVDAWPDSRRAHVAYALAVARVAAARRHWVQVLETVGTDAVSFASEGDDALSAAVLRAHALEQTATVDDAVLALEQTLARHHRAEVEARARRLVPGVELCPGARRRGLASCEKASPPQRRVTKVPDARWLLWGAVVLALLALLAATQNVTLIGRPFEQLLLVLALATGVAWAIARPRTRRG